MAYKHGVYTQEVATSLVPMTQTDSGLIVAVGTAPTHLASDPAKANVPKLCYNYKEAVEAMGYSGDWEKYSLCEVIYTHFALFNMAPVVLINVLDAANSNHVKSVANESFDLNAGMGKVTAPAALLDTLKVAATAEGDALVKDTDYTVAYDDDENLVITALPGGALSDAAKGYISYKALDAAAITTMDIIGGVNSVSGANEGLEAIEDVYPKFGLVPGIIIAPGWSNNPDVAAVMKAKEENIDGHFKAISICDADDSVRKYTDVKEWKDSNNYRDKGQVLCWPKLTLHGVKYHLSAQLASLMSKVDAAHDDIPYKSPSNESLQADGAVNGNDEDVVLSSASAAYLNGQGIYTALNSVGGWKGWGNRTTAYPSGTDPKDTFIAIRRMFNYISNKLVTSFWQKIDEPTNKRLIEAVINSANIWLNGLTARGALLGGRVEFREDENTKTDLMDGILRFHVYMTPPTPAEEIEFVQEYDPNYLSSLFD